MFPPDDGSTGADSQLFAMPTPDTASFATPNRQPADAPLPPGLDPRGPGGRGPGGPGSSGGGSRPPRRHRKLKWFLGGTGGVIALVIILIAVSAFVAWHKFHRVDVGFGTATGAAGDLNILVVGSDSRAGLTKKQQNQLHVGHDPGQRTDTMMLIHIPSGSGKATIVSLPRDSYVKIPAYTADGHHYPASMNKLNAAFSLGGAQLLIQTVEQDTGVHLDHYIQVDFEGFVNIVNAVGGVDVCTDTPINDPVHYDPSTGGYVGSGLKLPAGTTHVNGTVALEYVRAREFDPTEDLGRMRRQQEFVADLIHRVESTGVLLNPLRLNSLIDSTASSLTLDKNFGIGAMKTLIERLHSMSPSNVQLMTVPLADPENPSINEPIDGVETSVVKWDPSQSKKLYNDLQNDHKVNNLTKPNRVPIAPSDISLKVLNATTTNGLAAKAASSLQGEGFGVSSTGNAPKGSDPSKTVVLYGSNRAQSAQSVAAAVPGATKQLDSKLGAQGLELVVGSGYHGTVAVKVATNAPTINSAAGKQCETD